MKLARDEFEQMAIEQIDTLYRFARRLSRDAHGAEDLVQETYVRALRSRGEFELREFGIRPWLLRILFNLHLSRRQRDGRRPVAVQDEALAGAAAPAGASLRIDLKRFDYMDQRLVHAVEELPEEFRAVLLLWAVEDLSYEEISEALGIPMGTVMSRLHRARQRLAQELHDYAVEQRLVRE